MVQLKQEPPFQSKRHFEVKQQYDISQQQHQHTETYPKQDDFFIIGPSNSKFAPSIAYPNRLKYRSRSISPGPENIRHIGKRPVTTTNTEQTLGEEDRWKRSRPVKRAHTLHPKRNEAVQTEAPRKTLEAEIQRIRDDLERRKKQLREPRKRVTNQANRTNTTKLVESKYCENLQSRLRTPSPEKKVDFTPNAPRGDRVTQFWGAQKNRRQRSASPDGKIRQTEYQRAYRAPEIPRPTKSAQVFKRPVTAEVRAHMDIPLTYETEYQREYKPFKYVPAEELKSTCVLPGDRIHIVPIPRPRSAMSLKAADFTEWGYPKDGSAVAGTRITHKARSLTPPPDCSNLRKSARKRRYMTEYAAKYKNYFGFSQPGSRTHSPGNRKPAPRTWLTEWDQLQQQAELYRERDRSSHFTRNHLAQLESACVDAWDPPSVDQTRVNTEKMRLQLSMPAAGKPSLSPTSQLQGHLINSNAVMYDSHHVAEILDPDDLWDCSSSDSDPSEIHWVPQQNSRLAGTKLRPSHSERLSSMFPQGQITRDSGPVAGADTHYPETTCLTDPASRNSSLYGNLVNHAVDHREYGTQWDRGHKSPVSTYLEASFSTPSPLSVRSMESSASVASKTLERARKQRDRVFRDYEKQHNRAYSPYTYSSGTTMNHNTNSNPRTLYS